VDRAISRLDLRLALRALPAAPTLTLVGVPIRLDLSCVFALALASWTVADAILPEAAPGRAARAYWAGGTTAALLLLASLGIHELAHAVAARRVGLRVRGITLSLLGGALELADRPTTALNELRVAVAGPLANLVLAIAAAITHVALVELGADPLSAAVAGVLAMLNTFIALFNLVPAVPLDGGRIAAALVWLITGRQDVAARTLSVAGRLLGGVCLFLCVMGSASGDAGIALWLALIGLALWSGEPAPADRRVAIQA
jgi:Zn-dependent protease